MDMYYCDVCNLNIQKSSEESHIQGKKHKLRLHTKHVQDRKESHGIFIGGLPPNAEPAHFIRYFSQYGKVSNSFFGAGFCIIEYADEQVARNLINRGRFHLMGRMYTIKQRKMRNPVGGTEEEESATVDEIELIKEGIKNLTVFDDQVEKFLKIITPDPNMLPKYKALCSDLESALSMVYPKSKVHPFGSTITDLHSNNSDVDIYVQLPSKPRGNDQQFAAKAVNSARNYLNKRPKLFHKVIAIPKAKTPIVKCVHSETKIHCDFNFKNMLGVCNSNVIKYYISLNPKIKSLMVLVKQWARSQELTNYHAKFTNYALVMMIIFFLQQKPFGFPSIRRLQEDPSYENMQEGWNGGFQCLPFKSVALEEIKFLDLVIGFFEYYANFDYSLNVICPYFGVTVTKASLLKLETTPQELELYCNNVRQSLQLLDVESPVCTQDPFEQNHNLTRQVTSKFLEEFLAYCKLILENLKSEQPSLYKMFTERPLMHYNPKTSETTCEFPILKGSYLLYIQEKTNDGEDIRDTWFGIMCSFLIDFISKVLKFEIENTCFNESVNKTKRLDGQCDVHDDNTFDSVRYECKGYINVWESRKSIAKDIRAPDLKSVLDKEAHLSDYITDVLYKGVITKDPLINVTVTVTGMKNPLSALIHIQKTDTKKGGYFSTFSTYISTKLPALFASYEKELNDNVKSKDDMAKENPLINLTEQTTTESK